MKVRRRAEPSPPTDIGDRKLRVAEELLGEIESRAPRELAEADPVGHVVYGLISDGSSQGIIDNGQKTRMYWEMKMLNRALLSNKEMLTVNYTGDAYVYATRDTQDLYVIVLNAGAAQTINVNLAAIPSAAGASVDLYHVGVGTEEVGAPAATVQGQSLAIAAAADTHYVAVIKGAGAPSAGGTGGSGAGGSGAGGSAGNSPGAGGSHADAGTRDGATAAAGRKADGATAAAGAGGAAADPSSEEESDETSPAPGASCRTAPTSRGSGFSLMLGALLGAALLGRRARNA